MRLLAATLALFIAATTTPARTETHTLKVDGIDRTYVLIGAQQGQPRPLILALHGNWGTGAQFAEYGQWEAVARKHSIAVVLPDGINRAWNDGRPIAEMMGRKPREGLDDVRFLTELVTALAAKGVADRSRLFVTGISNGGMMTLRLMCDRADLFAAGAAVIASMPQSLPARCKPNRPVPLMLVNGTADKLVPYAPSDRFIGTENTAAFWRNRNGCSGEMQRTWLEDRDPEDGSKVERIRYTCPPAAPVVILRIDGGGHQMPSHSHAFALEAVLGRRNHDFEGAEAIWAFFEPFRR